MSSQVMTIVSESRLEGNYFLKNDLVTLKDYPGSDDILVTITSQNTLKAKLTEMIQSTNDYLKICSFLIEDYDIVQILEKVIRDRHPAVFILTAVQEKDIKSNLLKDDESFVAEKRHFEFIDHLVKLGVHVRASKDTHAKFVIRDGIECLVTSANLTRASLNTNPESGINVQDKITIVNLERIFDIIFRYGTDYHRFVSLDSSKHFIEQKNRRIIPSMFPLVEKSSLRWTYGARMHNLLNELKAIVQRATEYISIATYSVVELDQLEELTELLESFVARGGVVKIFTRSMNHRQDHLVGCQKLCEIGCEVFADDFNHSKGIVSDNREGMIFTANIDGRHGLTSGFEVGVYLDNESSQLRALEKFIEWQINNAPYRLVADPTREELRQYFEVYYRKRNISGILHVSKAELVISGKKNKDENFNNYIKSLRNKPCFIRMDQASPSHINIDGQYYKLTKIATDKYKLGGKLNYYPFGEDLYWEFEELIIRFT